MSFTTVYISLQRINDTSGKRRKPKPSHRKKKTKKKCNSNKNNGSSNLMFMQIREQTPSPTTTVRREKGMKSIVSLTCRQASGLRLMPKPSPRSLTSQAKNTGKKEKQERERNTESKQLHSNYSHSVETLSDSSKDGIAEKKQTRGTLQGRCPIATRGRTNESGNDDGKYTHEDNTNKLHTLYSTTTRHCTIRRQCERKYTYVTIQKTRCSARIHTYTLQCKEEMKYKYKDII